MIVSISFMETYKRGMYTRWLGHILKHGVESSFGVESWIGAESWS